MAEKDNVAEGESLTYEGSFKLKEFVAEVKRSIENRGYGWIEKAHTEILNPDGKVIEIKWESSKSVSDYAKKKIDIKLKLENVKDKVIEKAGQKIKCVTGKVTVGFDASLLTDYEVRWKENKPAFYLIRSFFEKYVYSPYGKKIKDEVRSDVDGLKEDLSAFLNLYKY